MISKVDFSSINFFFVSKGFQLIQNWTYSNNPIKMLMSCPGHHMRMTYVTFSGTFFKVWFDVSVHFFIIHKKNQQKKVNLTVPILIRCEYIQIVYDEILKNKDDEESKVSLRAIDNITKLLTNFAKYGWVHFHSFSFFPHFHLGIRLFSVSRFVMVIQWTFLLWMTRITISMWLMTEWK